MSVTTNLKKEADAINAYQDFIINNGAPNKTCTDNIHVYLGKLWKNSNRKYCIELGRTVPYHKSSKYAKVEGGNRKYWLAKLLHFTPHAPPKYWSFGLDFINVISQCLSKKSLDEFFPLEMKKGETPDISIFCFPWFSPVWFYAPNLDFPTDRMRPGFFIGISHNVGD